MSLPAATVTALSGQARSQKRRSPRSLADALEAGDEVSVKGLHESVEELWQRVSLAVSTEMLRSARPCWPCFGCGPARRQPDVLITDGQDSYRLAQATAGKGVRPLT
jgi:hypothetical protein